MAWIAVLARMLVFVGTFPPVLGLPQHIPQVAGFCIACEYRPAQEVGGDFFQAFDTPDCGVLLVTGDASGKGVCAAMLVALIIGALRTIAEETEEPQAILQRLNHRLVGRTGGGFATCLCTRIATDGTMTIANAGHLAHWLDGQEIEVPHDLPLGLTEGVEHMTAHPRVPEPGSLIFVSDGVVEAQNGRKELFGFDRVSAMSLQPAARTADAAEKLESRTTSPWSRLSACGCMRMSRNFPCSLFVCPVRRAAID